MVTTNDSSMKIFFYAAFAVIFFGCYVFQLVQCVRKSPYTNSTFPLCDLFEECNITENSNRYFKNPRFIATIFTGATIMPIIYGIPQFIAGFG